MDKGLVTNQIIVNVGYDIENTSSYSGEITTDRYGRKIPKQAHGTINLDRFTSSSKLIREAVLKWYDKYVDKTLTIRRVNISANHVVEENIVKEKEMIQQMDIFTDYELLQKEEEKLKKDLEKEKRLQQATLQIKKKYGKNAVLKGMNFEEGATAKERNGTIGGHKA